jgi:frataxin
LSYGELPITVLDSYFPSSHLETVMFRSRGLIKGLVKANNPTLKIVQKRRLVSVPPSSSSSSIFTTKRQRIVEFTGLRLNPSQIRYNSITASTDGSTIPDDVKNLSIEEYHKVSDQTFEILLDELDDFFENNRIMEAEVDEEAGVMQINCSEGTYVINKQPPTKQIWLSSPISGPKRFDLHDGQWISLRDNIKLSELLQDEMNQMYGGFEWSNPF